MNKILPIILVVVLSGCGQSPLENCADERAFNEHLILSPSSMSFKEKLKRGKYARAAAECEKFKEKYPEVFREKFK